MLKATLPRLALCLLLANSLLSPPTLAQPPEPPPEIQSQVQDGVRMRIKQAYWDIPQVRNSQLNYPGKGLVLSYEAEHENTPYSGDLFRAITGLVVQGPNGEPVSYSNLEGRNSIFLSDVNPHWPSVSLDFEVQTLPDDQKLAQGRKQSEFTFHNLPFPRQVGQTVPLNHTRTTDWGTRVTLQKIALLPFSKRNKTPYYYLTFNFETHPGSDDLAFNLWNSRATFMDIAGNDISGLWPRRKLDNDDKQPATRAQQQWEFSIPQLAFAAQDIPGGVGFKLRLEEWSPSRKQVQGFQQFRFELPLGTLTDNLPHSSPPVSLDSQGGPVTISAEAWRTGQDGVAALRLWTRPTQRASHNGWVIKSAQAVERKQSLSRMKPPFYRPGRAGWKAGSPAQPNENSVDFRWVLETPQERKKPPENHTLKLALEEVRHATSRFQFTSLPRPHGKAITSLNRTQQSDSQGKLTILAMANYQDNKLPANWPVNAVDTAAPATPPSAIQLLPPSSGIAVACRWTPAGGSETVQATHHVTARDQLGRELLDQPLAMLLPTAPDKWPVDEQLQGLEMEIGGRNEHYDFTLFLLPPASDATSFTLDFSVQETITTGRERSVDFMLPHQALLPLQTTP